MKTPVEKAYIYTMKIVGEIKKLGIKTKIKRSRARKETIEKYHPPERLHHRKWRHITFYPQNKEESNMIYREALKLAELGIYFDSSAGCGGRDWEIDWSLKYRHNTNTEHLEVLEELINSSNILNLK